MVGCLWNNDRQGDFLRHPRYGFLPAAASRGHTMIDPGGYQEPATEFGQHITQFLDKSVDIVTYAGTPEDLALFYRQAAKRALHPKLVTSSRWLAYPNRDLRHTSIATVVYWTPRHPFRSSLDGTTPAELAEAYERASGNHWLQPLGLAYALVEVAAHALSTADDPTDRTAVAEAVGQTRLHTMAGLLDWTAGPVANVALVRLIGGQWQPGWEHPLSSVSWLTRGSRKCPSTDNCNSRTRLLKSDARFARWRID